MEHEGRGKPPAKVLGWCEWVELPELGILALKAKVDTGAKTSSLHAAQIQEFERDGETWVSFVTPCQANSAQKLRSCCAKLVDRRKIRSSNGQSSFRYVITTPIIVDSTMFSIEISLSQRDNMRFNMLLGRSALAGRFFVDPSRCYLATLPAHAAAISQELDK
ncbi:MAG: ATP-dependent zinc protease family protein [Vibrionaceae bacterium]